jgi:hypothetical protein
MALLAATAAVTLMFAGLASAKKQKPPPGPTLTYTMFLLPEVMKRADAMNQWGDIVGDQYLYTAEGVLVDLTTMIDPVAFPDLDMGVAVDINDERQIVGTCGKWEWVERVVDGELVLVEEKTPRAFLATFVDSSLYLQNFTLLPDKMTIDGVEYEVQPSPTAVNNNGEVVGTEYMTIDSVDWGYHAFYWDGVDTDEVTHLIATEISSPIYGTRAMDINDAGQIVGQFRVEDGSHAFRLTIDGGFEVEFIDLGGLRKRPINNPAAINQYGEVTGNCRGPYYYDRAYFYSNEDGIENLGTLFNSRYSVSNAASINSSGHIVGGSGQAHDWTDPEGGPFLYTKQLGMVGLAAMVVDPPAGAIAGSLAPQCVIDPKEGKVHGLICGNVEVIVNDVYTYRACLLTPSN